jgi:ribose-phosphate pyrophosphokinase
MQMYGLDDGRFEKDFYKIDMSSKNPRWPPQFF